MDIYLTEFGSKLKKSGEAFCIINSKGEHYFSPNQVECFVIEDKISVSSDALQLAITNDIPIILSDKLGNVIGKVWQYKFGSNAKIRRKQLEFFQTEVGSELGKEWIIKKLKHQINHLEKLSSIRKITSYSEDIAKMKQLMDKLSNLNGSPSEIRETLMGYEGNISKIYFKCISDLLPERWKFKEREYRGAKTPYNIVLNYLYGILYSKVEHALIIAGLDPFIGIFHTDNYNKASLLFDFIEQFRFLALEQVTTLFSKGIIQQNFFIEKEDKSIILASTKKGIIVQEFYKTLERSGSLSNKKNYTHKNLIKLEAKNLATSLMNL
ncbi:CRISPR-associated endonuclease Cas1 [Cetobacterium sp. 8H]|uniref:CRISPR-associated endonuclease Cas1 n=1 Tax=Cetobacterium sp. 8H TaxID=2759681 RepID=UPI00163BAF5E|nr:CRISPR-associated endonuclease Cas1 [Cetobacterium sp. 8H]MBC2849908.1 CRISPR-associated endonuclease Cas1 [Cetobacterium sp. 8H]